MKKFLNKPQNFVDEMLDGLVAAHPPLVRDGSGGRVIRHAGSNRKGKVGVVSGGGSGHLPLFTGYVGQGLLDACAIGDVFEGPSVDACQEAIRAADGGAGVVRLYGNYGGDRMNFDMAGELLEGEISTTTVLGTDDIASGGTHEREKRRGVAGIVFAYKATGAAAEEGRSLSAVTDVARKATERTRTIGMALAGCELPGASRAGFSIAEGEVEMGLGIHGEPGVWRDKLKPSDELVDEMLERLFSDLPAGAGNRVAVLVNSLGATSLEELYILYRRVSNQLADRKLEIVQPLVGRFVTSLEMAGVSLSLCFVDEELEALLKAPASCPFWQVS